MADPHGDRRSAVTDLVSRRLRRADRQSEFPAYVEQILVPSFGPAMSWCSTIWPFTEQPEVRAAIAAVGAHLRFLPPYNPDFNPIELASRN